MQFDDALERYEAFIRTEKALTVRTQRAYLYDLRRFHLNIDSIEPVEAIQTAHIRRYLDRQQKGGAGPSAISRTISSLRMFFMFLRDEDVIENSPAERLRNPKLPQLLPQFLTHNEAMRLLRVPNVKTWKGARDRAMLSLMLYTGARVDEVSCLDLINVNLKTETVLIFGKGQVERLAPLARAAVKDLKCWFDQRPQTDCPALFTTRYRQGYQRLGVRMIQKMIGKRGKACGLADLHPHALRHTCGTLAHAAGVDLIEIKAILGHRSIQSTARYVHCNPRRLREAVAKIEAYIENGGETDEEKSKLSARERLAALSSDDLLAVLWFRGVQHWPLMPIVDEVLRRTGRQDIIGAVAEDPNRVSLLSRSL